ncbi:MAG: T9SS type A sorting domain-containing protein [Flavobacteriales bacterium]|nr:T9SS type A sorting domain-containing protein [Flavobacteriales bacterium]
MRRTILLTTLAVVNLTQAADFAGPNQYICGTSTVMAAFSLSPGESGLWSVVEGSASFSNITSPFSPVTGLGFGENVLRWTVTGSSGSASDLVSIWCYNNAMPAADAGADQNVSDPPGIAQLNGSAPIHPGTCTWTIVAGTGTFSDPNEPNATVSFLGMGTNTLQWTCDNGPCGVTSDIVQVELTVVGIDEVAMEALDMHYDHTAQRMVFGQRSQKVSMVLLNAQGRTVRQVNAPAGTGIWDLADLPAGLYFAVGYTEGRRHTFRFVVMR